MASRWRVQLERWLLEERSIHLLATRSSTFRPATSSPGACPEPGDEYDGFQSQYTVRLLLLARRPQSVHATMVTHSAPVCDTETVQGDVSILAARLVAQFLTGCQVLA